MKKEEIEKLKRYHPDIILKDYTISFVAGVMGGFTILIFSLCAYHILERQYGTALLFFVLYVIVASLTFLIGFKFVKKKFGK